MALSFDPSPVARLVESVAGKATLGEWLLEAAAAVGALALAWFISGYICGHVRVNPRWKFGKGDFRRVAFPLFALVFVWAAQHALERFQGTDSLAIVVSLLVAWTVIRAAVYILGHVIHEGGFQHAVIRVVSWAAWIAVVLYVTGLLPDVMGALDSHGFRFGKSPSEITLLDLLRAVAAIFFAVTLALWIARVTESRVLSSDSMEMTTRVVIVRVVRVAVLLVAIFIALPLAGIDVTTLSIFSGALGVGLGFGLQKIASNYVSGFIVLLERSLRIGDVVAVDNKRGEVTAIETRYTVIKGADGVETIIPNEKLITESVSHQTYSDPRISLVAGVTVAYESDVDAACRILADAARRQERVIADPPVAARVKQLTEHGIELEVTLWISDPVVGDGDLRSELLKEVLRAFRAEGIEIAHPRRDIRVIATPETQFQGLTSNT